MQWWRRLWLISYLKKIKSDGLNSISNHTNIIRHLYALRNNLPKTDIHRKPCAAYGLVQLLDNKLIYRILAFFRVPSNPDRYYSQLMLVVVDNRFFFEKRNTFEFKQRMIQWMRDVVADPLWHHYCHHDWQQKGNVIRYLHLTHTTAERHSEEWSHPIEFAFVFDETQLSRR